MNPALLARRLTAAARLAAIYLLGVIVLIVPMELARELPPTNQLWEFVAPFVVIFMIAFAILAFARRAGFAVLWLILLALWTSSLASGHSVLSIPEAFFFWSLLGLPLFALGVLGTIGSPRLANIRWRVPSAWLVVAGWAILMGAAWYWQWLTSDVHFADGAYGAVGIAARFVWAPAPFVIGLVEIARVWVGIQPMKLDPQTV